jgi:Flagellar biosynthesis pathway, component FlhB
LITSSKKRDYKKNLKMTMQEIKDEYKEMEGNPQIKQARARKQRQLALSRMMNSISKSNVVITNPTHIAVAIKYDENEDSAPVVVAKRSRFFWHKESRKKPKRIRYRSSRTKNLQEPFIRMLR